MPWGAVEAVGVLVELVWPEGLGVGEGDGFAPVGAWFNGVLHCPISARTKQIPKNHRTTFAHPEVRTCFAPHFGQDSALVLSSPPHSLHLVNATGITSCLENSLIGLTPELSRAAKRRRLE